MAFDRNRTETYSEATRSELIQAAHLAGGQGALVEAMFRLMDSIDKQERSTNRLNKMLLLFTIAIFVLTAVQVYFQFHTPPAQHFTNEGFSDIPYSLF